MEEDCAGDKCAREEEALSRYPDGAGSEGQGEVV